MCQRAPRKCSLLWSRSEFKYSKSERGPRRKRKWGGIICAETKNHPDQPIHNSSNTCRNFQQGCFYIGEACKCLFVTQQHHSSICYHIQSCSLWRLVAISNQVVMSKVDKRKSILYQLERV